MKAIVHTRYGPPDVLQLQEVEKPTPNADQVLIKVHAAALNVVDLAVLKGAPFLARPVYGGFRKPKPTILGADVAGRIEAIGSQVSQFRVGDDVYGDLLKVGAGAYADYVCAPATALAPKPATLSFAQAAAVPLTAVTALQALRDKGRLQPAQKVLINGASGGVGTFAVQLAKVLGAEVTAVCSPPNLATARSIGADHVIDYTQTDFTKNGQHYDLIVAVNGYHPLSAYRRALSPHGIYVVIGGSMAQILQGILFGPLLSRFGSQKMGFMGIAKPNQKDLNFLNTLFETGKLLPVIDKKFRLSEVPAALRYLSEGHAQGKIVITLD